MRKATSTVRSWRWPCACVALLLGASATVLGCGTPEKRYEVLSLFFDGVPNPNAEAEAQKADRSGRSGATVALVRHKPFVDENCVACHKNQNDGPRAAFFTAVAAKAPKDDVCMDCHAEVPTKYEVMHGPVAVSACSYCHNPHSSKHEALLKAPAAKLCMSCHGPTGLSQMTAGHADAESNCLECHSGHGGGRNLLKTRAVALSVPASVLDDATANPDTSPLEGLKSGKSGGTP